MLRQPLFVILAAALIATTTSLATAGQLADFHMVSKDEGVVLLDGSVYLVSASTGRMQRVAMAKHVAVDRVRSRMLLVEPSSQGTRLALTTISDSPRRIMESVLPVEVMEVGYANCPPFDAFFVRWVATDKKAGSTRVQGVYLYLHSDGMVVFQPAPGLSGLVQNTGPGSLVFSRSMPYTYAGSVLVTAVAPFAAPDDLDPEADTYLLVVSQSRIVKAIPVPGITSARAVAFSGDGKQVMAKAARGVRDWVLIVNLESEKVVPCTYIPYRAAPLAASHDLQQAVIREYNEVADNAKSHPADRLTLVGTKARTSIAEVSPDTNVIADYAENAFFLTDGDHLWSVAEDGKVIRLRLVVSSDR